MTLEFASCIGIRCSAKDNVSVRVGTSIAPFVRIADHEHPASGKRVFDKKCMRDPRALGRQRGRQGGTDGGGGNDPLGGIVPLVENG